MISPAIPSPPLGPQKTVSQLLEDVIGIRHGFYTRQGGCSRGIYGSLNTGLGSADERTAVLANRAAIRRDLGVEGDSLATPHQAHTAVAVYVEQAWEPGKGPRADGLVSDRPGLVIGVGTADCVPVLFADPANGVVGAAHAGWRGALGGILEATIELMVARGARRGTIQAAVGPAISAAAYEVGPEFVAEFCTDMPQNRRFFAPSLRENHALFDLPAYVMMRLEEAGVGYRESLDYCTYGDSERFFSYRRATHRREADYGRQLSVIARDIG